MAEVQEETVKYQWIKGDNFGKIVEVQSEDDDFIYFTDGNRIFKEVASEFLEKVIDGNIPLPGADQAAKVITGEIKPVANPVQNQTTPNVETQSSTTEPTVMGKMIMKMSKKNVVNVPIQINLNIPTPALYSMLSEGMEAEDLNEEIMQVALQQIEIDNLTEYLKENVSLFLSQYYS